MLLFCLIKWHRVQLIFIPLLEHNWTDYLISCSIQILPFGNSCSMSPTTPEYSAIVYRLTDTGISYERETWNLLYNHKGSHCVNQTTQTSPDIWHRYEN